jgi:hypothetical protein
MRAALLIFLLGLGGCLDGPAAPLDASASVDMTPPSADLYGVDYAGDYNCVALNACEIACDQRNLLCLTACHNMATPSALMADQAVQQCFNQYCPQASDLGTAICAVDNNGMRSAACTQCLNNAQLPTTVSCSPSTAPECHACAAQALACKNDR